MAGPFGLLVGAALGAGIGIAGYTLVTVTKFILRMIVEYLSKPIAPPDNSPTAKTIDPSDKSRTPIEFTGIPSEPTTGKPTPNTQSNSLQPPAASSSNEPPGLH